jgi:hypothetical protein
MLSTFGGLFSPDVHAAPNHTSTQMLTSSITLVYDFKYRLVSRSLHMPTSGKFVVHIHSTVWDPNDTMKIGVFADDDNSDSFMVIKQCDGVNETGNLPAGNYHVVLMKDNDGIEVQGTMTIDYA